MVEGNIMNCLECKKPFDCQTDIWLCDDCQDKFDLDKLWEMHDKNEIDALDFNERDSVMERFRK